MNTRQFCVWLKGIYDVMSIEDENFKFTEKQMALIKKNLNDVFTHETDAPAEKFNDSAAGYPPPYSNPGKTQMRC